MSDRTVTLTGLPMIQYMMSERFNYSARRAIAQALETGNLSDHQRRQRQNIRNGYLVETIETIRRAKDRFDGNEFAQLCLQEMIDTCEAQDVDDHGKTYDDKYRWQDDTPDTGN